MEAEDRMSFNNNSTMDTEPLVMIEPVLAQWYADLLKAFPELVRRFQEDL